MTPAEREALDYIGRPAYEKAGDGPWERGWVRPGSAARSRILRRLADAGLVEMQPGRPAAKIGPRFRSIEPISDEERAEFRLDGDRPDV